MIIEQELETTHGLAILFSGLLGIFVSISTAFIGLAQLLPIQLRLIYLIAYFYINTSTPAIKTKWGNEEWISTAGFHKIQSWGFFCLFFKKHTEEKIAANVAFVIICRGPTNDYLSHRLFSRLFR